MHHNYVIGFMDKCAQRGVDPEEIPKWAQLYPEMNSLFHDETYQGTEPTGQTDTPAQSSMEAKAPDSGSTEQPGPAPTRRAPAPKKPGTGTPSENRTATPAVSSEESHSEDAADPQPGTARPTPKKNPQPKSNETAEPVTRADTSAQPQFLSGKERTFSDNTWHLQQRSDDPGLSAFGVPDAELPLAYPIMEPLSVGEPDLSSILGALLSGEGGMLDGGVPDAGGGGGTLGGEGDVGGDAGALGGGSLGGGLAGGGGDAGGGSGGGE